MRCRAGFLVAGPSVHGGVEGSVANDGRSGSEHRVHRALEQQGVSFRASAKELRGPPALVIDKTLFVFDQSCSWHDYAAICGRRPWVPTPPDPEMRADWQEHFLRDVLRDQNTKEAREALGNRGSMGVFHGLGFSVDGIGPRG